LQATSNSLREEIRRTGTKTPYSKEEQLFQALFPVFNYDPNRVSYKEPEIATLFTNIRTSVEEGIQTRIFNIAKLGLLAGQWRTDSRTTGGISDAVVYLNYLEEIYEDTVNALGSEIRLGKHQSTAEADRYLGRAERSDLDVHTLVSITLRLACLADNIFWTLATTNCVVRQLTIGSEPEETITEDLIKRTQLAQRKLLSTLHDIEEANKIYFTDDLADQFAGIKRYGEFVSNHDNIAPSFESVNLVEAFRLTDPQHSVLEDKDGPGLLLYCHTSLAIQKIYNSLDPINIRQIVKQPIIDFSIVAARCAFSIVDAVWNEINTIYGEDAPCPLLNDTEFTPISQVHEDPEREHCEKFGSKDAHTTLKRNIAANPSDPRLNGNNKKRKTSS
jgi:hypothetical protein